MRAWIGWVADVCILVFALYVALAAFRKLANQEEFAAILLLHGAIPQAWIGPASWGVPVIELVIGTFALASLPLRTGPMWAGTALGVLFLTFAAYALKMHHQPPPMPVGCGCGLSRAAVEDWAGLALRHALLATLLLIAAVRPTAWNPTARS